MAGVFSSQVITVAGRSLIASATATNQIVFVKALSAGSVPADPSVTSGYDGVQGTITSSSATNNVARVVTSYNNTNTSTPQPVKAIALMGRLASQSDADAVIFAYCTDSDSEIYFPGNNAPEQITRFAYNIAFEGTAPLEVTETGAASLSDLERFVSLHRAGDPTTGEEQTIKGSKTFDGEVTLKRDVHMSADIVPTKASTYKIGDSVGSRLSDVYTETLHASTIIGGDTIASNWNIEVGNSVMPESSTVTNSVSSVSLGAGNARFGSVYAGTVNGVNIEVGEVRSSNKATLTFKEDAILVDKDIVPANRVGDTQSCGNLTRPWKELCVKNAIYLTNGASTTTNNLIIYEDDGGINLDNSYTGGDAGSFWFRKRTGGTMSGATVSAGEFIGAPMGVVSERHTPTELPNSSAYVDAPTWDIKKGTIVMAMPCWATARDVFMNRRGAGDTITVTFPDVSQAPFQHGNNYDNDPEKGAWYIASWRFGSGDSPKSMFVPFSTLDSANSKELFSYLPAGTYRLLCCVEECISVGHAEYHPEGMCVLLQKIS